MTKNCSQSSLGRLKNTESADARNHKISLLILFVLCFVLQAVLAKSEDYTFFHENVLGTSLEIAVEAVSKEEALTAEQAVLSEIERLNAIFSTYDPESEINRLLETPLGSPRYMAKELIEVLVACDWWRVKTAGAFNPLTQELSDLWMEGEKTNSLPDPEQLRRAVEGLSQSTWKIDESYEMVERIKEGRFSLNAIAKGYITDHACQKAMNSSEGIDGVLVSIGGDITVLGSKSRKIGVTDPESPADNARPLINLQIKNQTVTTSASYARGFDIQQVHYSHIIDPRTGYPVSGNVISATVISDSASQADALSTALMVLTPEEGIQLIESLPQTECILIGRDRTMLKTSGIAALLSTEANESISESLWPPGFVFQLNLEINQPAQRKYHRPYIAVWIEDDEGKMVKTLCLWMERGSSWVRKLSRWSRIREKDPQLLRTLTSATRMPGKYRLDWNGLSDDGTPLLTGHYQLYIEAVREKGSHQLIREDFVLGERPIMKELSGNLEIKSASITYGTH